VPGLADLLKCVAQGILAVGLERNVEINCGAIGRVAQGDPIVRGMNPLVFYKHFTPR
jgi:hypothetical protein